MNQAVSCIIAGAIAGLGATLPMSLVMLAGRKRNFLRALDPLPPRQITERVLAAVGVDDELNDDSKEALTVVNHFAYGASMGGVYGLISPQQSSVGATTTGIGFGIGVWAVSYLGWLPKVGLYRSATDDAPQRNLRILAAHVVWGAALGYLTERAKRRIVKESAGPTREQGANGRPIPSDRLVSKPR